YTRNPGTPGGVSDVFNYTLTDGDGDTSTTTLTINIGDSTPHTGENAVVRLDDDALANGNPGGVGDDDPDTANLTGNLAGGGGDGPLTFAVQTTGAPSGFSYVSGGAGVVLVQQGGHTVLTVTVGADGSYSVVQNAPIDHAAGGDENNQVFTINYTVTDQDNDSAPGSFTINVDDDTPVVGLADRGTPQLVVDETDLSVNATASFANNFSVHYGADGPAASNPLAYSLGISAPGADIGLSLVFHDDGPSISASSNQPSLTVDETNLAVNATASFASVFTSSFGADGAGTVTYALGMNAGSTGLVDIATGQAIVLVNNAGVIEGHVGNAAVAI